MRPPKIGITLGDPGGIGPEVLLKALEKKQYRAELILFGSLRVLLHHSKKLGIPFLRQKYEIIDIDNVAKPYFGPNPAESGSSSIEYMERAFQFFRERRMDGLVTGPIHKQSWHLHGYSYPGQTEFCAERTNSREYCMLMAGSKFRIAILSTHLSLREALQRIRREAILKMVRLVHREFLRLGFPAPRIGCSALNPHAGENGAFGTEEQKEIIPALEKLRQEGIRIDGPLAPETIFRMAVSEKKWDVLIAMYHDQAMIPLKLLAFDRSANVTLGLPFIRTSPDHGTAFDIAGKGVANPGSMIYALDLAIDWTKRRMRHADSRS